MLSSSRSLAQAGKTKGRCVCHMREAMQTRGCFFGALGLVAPLSSLRVPSACGTAREKDHDWGVDDTKRTASRGHPVGRDLSLGEEGVRGGAKGNVLVSFRTSDWFVLRGAVSRFGESLVPKRNPCLVSPPPFVFWVIALKTSTSYLGFFFIEQLHFVAGTGSEGCPMGVLVSLFCCLCAKYRAHTESLNEGFNCQNLS